VPTLELYGQARLLAGTRSVSLPAATLGAALKALATRHPELIGPVLQADGRLTPAYSTNINGLRFCSDPTEPLAETDEVLIISSLAGG
jgi:molybdopterin converting factor small subunit